eukprot:SAG11_NODE_5606_length_1510_cov_1.570517_1_plen_84_part_00
MNGVDAAALAAGQDWRAIEAAAHAYAALPTELTMADTNVADPDTGTSALPSQSMYRPLTRYVWEPEGGGWLVLAWITISSPTS